MIFECPLFDFMLKGLEKLFLPILPKIGDIYTGWDSTHLTSAYA